MEKLRMKLNLLYSRHGLNDITLKLSQRLDELVYKEQKRRLDEYESIKK